MTMMMMMMMMKMMMMTMVMMQAAGSWDTDTRRSGGSSGPSRDTSVREGLVRCGGNDQEAAKARLKVSTEFCRTQYLEKVHTCALSLLKAPLIIVS